MEPRSEEHVTTVEENLKKVPLTVPVNSKENETNNSLSTRRPSKQLLSIVNNFFDNNTSSLATEAFEPLNGNLPSSSDFNPGNVTINNQTPVPVPLPQNNLSSSEQSKHLKLLNKNSSAEVSNPPSFTLGLSYEKELEMAIKQSDSIKNAEELITSLTLGLSYEEELELAMKQSESVKNKQESVISGESARSNLQSSEQRANLESLNASEVANPPPYSLGLSYEEELELAIRESFKNEEPVTSVSLPSNTPVESTVTVPSTETSTNSEILSQNIQSDTPEEEQQNSLPSREQSTDLELLNQNLPSDTNNLPSSEKPASPELINENLPAPATAPASAPPEVTNVSPFTLGLSHEEELELAIVESFRNKKELTNLLPESSVTVPSIEPSTNLELLSQNTKQRQDNLHSPGPGQSTDLELLNKNLPSGTLQESQTNNSPSSEEPATPAVANENLQAPAAASPEVTNVSPEVSPFTLGLSHEEELELAITESFRNEKELPNLPSESTVTVPSIEPSTNPKILSQNIPSGTQPESQTNNSPSSEESATSAVTNENLPAPEPAPTPESAPEPAPESAPAPPDVTNVSPFTLGLSHEEEIELAIMESFRNEKELTNIPSESAVTVPSIEPSTNSEMLSQNLQSDTPEEQRQDNLHSPGQSTGTDSELLNQHLPSGTLQESQTINAPSSEEPATSAMTNENLPAPESAPTPESAPEPAPAPAPPEVTNVSPFTLGLSYEEELELAMKESESDVNSYRTEEELLILSPEQFKSLTEQNNEPPKQEDKNDKSENSNEKPAPGNKRCKICFDNPLDCVLVPCGHLATCIECAAQLKICPICRKEISSRIKVFKS